MFIYILVYSFALTLFYWGNQYKQKIIYFFAILLLVIFSGFRYGNGQDYNTYWSIYMDVESTSVEYGYYILCLFFREMGLGPQIMFVVAISITLIPIYKAIVFYNPRQIVFVFFVFLFAGFYAESFNAVRQYIAIGFFLYATRFIFDGSFKRYTLTILAGALFHMSILFLLPFYFLLKKRYSDRSLFLIFTIILGICFILPMQGLYTKIPYYGTLYLIENTQFATSANLGLGYGSKVILALCLIRLRHRIIEVDNRYNVIVNAFFFFILFMAVFKDIMVFLRIAYYFHIFMILIIPRLYLVFSVQSRIVVNAILVLYVFLLFGVQMSDKTGLLIPYRSNFDLITTLNTNRNE